MQSTGIIRSIDELGRIVIPKEIRNSLNWQTGTKIEILTDGNRVSLRQFAIKCSVCGKATCELQEYMEAHLCNSCFSKLNAD